MVDKTSLGGFSTIGAFVSDKTRCLEESQRDFRSIYQLMIREKDNIFCERMDGYSIKKTTYGMFDERTRSMAQRLACRLEGQKGKLVGLFMQNSEEWLQIFWAILMNGARPLLMNTRMARPLLEEVLRDYSVETVISDGETFPCTTVLLEELLSQEKTKLLSDGDWANEIVLMTSATTLKVKLCAYTGENMYAQICDSSRIIRESKRMKKHYKGALKQLVFLPLYHIFGLVAVFMWFGFYSRTFVFLRDYAPNTILNTVRRHHVTHVFAVPILWNRIYEEVLREVKRRDDGSYEKLMRGIALYGKLSAVPPVAKLFSKVAFRKVREEIFGESISAMISGGSVITGDVLRFFNAIGYPLSNGYGMTEIGITSVVLSDKWRALTDRNVGRPLHSVEYRISEEKELLVRGKTIAERVWQAGKPVEKDADGWFHTHDLAIEDEYGYYILGRMDDVVIGENGENINPDQTEQAIRLPGAEAFAIVGVQEAGQRVPVLVIQAPAYAKEEQLEALRTEAVRQTELMSGMIRRILLTDEPLIGENDFKVNRAQIAKRIENGTLREAKARVSQDGMDDLMTEVAGIFASVLKRTDPIGPDDHLILDLGGTSLDYFTVIMELQNRFGITFPQDGTGLSTAREIAEHIRRHGGAA